MKSDLTVKIYSSFEEENDNEVRRRAAMTPEKRLAEFANLMERRWGKHWRTQPIQKVVSFEKLPW
ncbi:hypothetical protein ACFL35_20590 [Candidatus Riflebacteria bacterium]